MSLTVEQAKQAGALAAEIEDLDATIAGLDEQINSGDYITLMSCNMSSGKGVTARGSLSVEGSVAMLTGAKTMLQGVRDAKFAELQALGG